jgi:hypothetical protein
MRTRYLLAALVVGGLAFLISLPCPAGEAPSKEKIDKLIEQMGSGNFTEREKATKELSDIGVPALEALRKAAKSDDAEVRKRAEELLPKIERAAESARVLAPKRVHLVYKDAQLSEALTDFQKQSGYSMELLDPDGKLKERKITLDTKDTTFWHALALFCEKAELKEASMEDLMQVPRPQQGGFQLPLPAQPVKPAPPAIAPAPAGGALAVQPVALRPARMRMAGVPTVNAQIILKDGKPRKLPTDDRSAIRIRALPKSDLFGNAPEGEIILPLEVAPEPKLQWEGYQGVHVEKAVDDKDQNLAQVIPQVEGAIGVGIGGGAGPALQMKMRMMQQMQRQMQMQMQMRGQALRMMGGTLNQQLSIQFKKGAKEAKSLKELKGIITAQLLTEVQPMIVADKLKAGEEVKGKEGGFIKIVEVKSEEKEPTIRLECEQPPFDKVMPAQQNPMQAFAGAGAAPIFIQAAPAGKKMPAPAPLAPVQGQIAVRGGGAVFGGAMPFMDSFNGLSVLDDKGRTLPIQAQMEIQFQPPGGGVQQKTIYTLTCRRDKEKGQPAKVVYLGRKRVTVDIPFTLSEVPLP